MKKHIRFTFMFALILFPCLLLGQQRQTIELADLYKKAKLKPVNREIKIVSSDSGAYLKIAENKKEGLVWLTVKDFKNGTIEIEMRGKDVFQRSFIGIAFHGTDDSTYDAVYCRPFNFAAKDSVRRIHAVQYISHPDFTWDRLRKQSNAVFEKAIINPPDPNGWFTMKLVIDAATVKAYINNASQPSLTVKKRSSRTSGKIGLFTADSSGGDFKTIRINHKK
ncbi:MULTISPECIES: family 16 glycoside hydrolase [Flavobacterium]|uniref:family 16 glycoside hydrolase n=1 Tax=Flavobacterium TaxID=237 RepID=UPI0021145E1F|nr:MULTISPECIES: family 16 glycoside hydrolase [Flavobacterium]UUF12394.1 DUF1080 domain-containing protein [Flavobacterium panici]